MNSSTNTITPTYKRFGKKWNINEILQLQREFELLELSIDEIAKNHQRSPNAIMCKLDQEGFAEYNELYSHYQGLNSEWNDINSESDDSIPSLIEGSEYSGSEYDDMPGLIPFTDTDSDNSNDQDSLSNLTNHVISLERKINFLSEIIINWTQQKTSNSFLSTNG